jgi:phytoene/squalene synthetase
VSPDDATVIALTPRGLREDLAAVTAFCRMVEDACKPTLGGPASERAASLGRAREVLAEFRGKLARCAEEELNDRLFLALGAAIRRHRLPPGDFVRVLDAAERTLLPLRFATWEQLVAHARDASGVVARSALVMHGHRPPEEVPATAPLFAQADSVTAGVTLARCWRDVGRDLTERDAVYIPSGETGLNAEVLREDLHSPQSPHVRRRFADELKELVRRTRELLAGGLLLTRHVHPSLAWSTWYAARRAEAMLSDVERAEYTTLWEAPGSSIVARRWLGLRARAGVVSGNQPPPRLA